MQKRNFSEGVERRESRERENERENRCLVMIVLFIIIFFLKRVNYSAIHSNNFDLKIKLPGLALSCATFVSKLSRDG